MKMKEAFKSLLFYSSEEIAIRTLAGSRDEAATKPQNSSDGHSLGS